MCDQWKAFKFFDVSQIKLPDEDAKSVFDQGKISSVTSGGNSVYVGTEDGVVHVLDQSFKPSKSFKAHDVGAVRHIKRVPETSYLVTLAEDLSNEPTLKVWALDKLDKRTDSPKCLSTVSIQNGRKQFPVIPNAAKF
ncbi:Vacuolar protein sorting-associated protein 11 [Elasticomyces elasticus]|nr:Vacuolar protein sorting-associated protein 11 [Elasticomyces elasticus]